MTNFRAFKATCILLLLLSSLTAFSQSGIKGIVFDKKYNEPLTGAAILIEGTTTGTTADIDGNFEIRVSAGTYTLVVSYVSYNTQRIPNVTVRAGQMTTLDIKMEEASMELQSVQVVGTARTDTDLSLLRNVRSALQVVSGISSQQISRTLDRDASEVVKRIPGVTIQDNRFIVVRGLNQRYNNVWLNNAATPSSETDVKAFSFDAIPSNMIDNLLIFKTGSAENAAEATGGFIKISTKNIPDRDFLNVEYGIGFNDATTFQQAYFLPGFASDLLGLGHISRGLPNDFPTNLSDIRQTSQRDAQALRLSNNWIAQPVIALPNQKVSVAHGKRWVLDHGARLGTITSFNYNSGYSTRADMLNYTYERYDYQNNVPVYFNKLNQDIYSRDVRIGLMHNWAYQNASGTRLEFKNLFNQIGIDRSSTSIGWNNYRQGNFEYYSNQYSARTTYSGQLTGIHRIQDSDNHKIDWNAGFSYANRIEPDRQNWSKKEVANGVFQYMLPPAPSINELGRLFMTNHEFVYTATANWENKVRISDFMTTLKAGIYEEYKTRRFSERSITYRDAYGSLSIDEINQLPFETLFTEQYMGTGKVISVDEQTDVANNYAAQNFLSAAYFSFVLPINNFNINAGIRAEYNRLMLQGYYNISSPVRVDNPELDLFPAINTSYNLNEKTLLRLAFSRSINRPEFREVSPLTYYDFTEKNSVVGNPDLVAAKVYNLDLRYELYPTPGETFTVAAFYKKFSNPIEMVSIAEGSHFSFDNALGATNFGVEVEVRKSLKFIGLDDFSVNMNASLIKSQVEFEDKQTERNRPLQGQSPYVFNTGIYYQNDKAGISSNLMYHVMGKRILVAAQLNQGMVVDPDIFEMPRHVVDLSFNKKIGKSMELKLGIKDLIAQKNLTQQTYEFVKDGQPQQVTLTNKLYNTGRTFSAGISWVIR